MAERLHPGGASRLTRIEPGDRLVALARTLDVRDPAAEAALERGILGRTSLGPAWLGGALYRHRSVFRSAADAPVWSHLELSYFREAVPAAAIDALVTRPPAGMELLRAEILLTTPSSFLLPRDWQGLGAGSSRLASLEYIEVHEPHLRDYRQIMRDYIGPAAARLVADRAIGTFRAMETAAVLHRHSALEVDWNQIHLCEVDAGFEGFGAAFDAALKEIAPDGGFSGIFAGLDRIRTMRRWTFNDAVVEADAALASAATEA